MEQIRNVQLHVPDPVDLHSHLQQSTLFADPANRRRLTVIEQRQIPHALDVPGLTEHFRLEAVLSIERFLREVLRVDDPVVFIVRFVLGHLRIAPPVLGNVQQLQMVTG